MHFKDDALKTISLKTYFNIDIFLIHEYNNSIRQATVCACQVSKHSSVPESLAMPSLQEGLCSGTSNRSRSQSRKKMLLGILPSGRILCFRNRKEENGSIIWMCSRISKTAGYTLQNHSWQKRPPDRTSDLLRAYSFPPDYDVVYGYRIAAQSYGGCRLIPIFNL